LPGTTLKKTAVESVTEIGGRFHDPNPRKE
jgi:hypothetical protein